MKFPPGVGSVNRRSTRMFGRQEVQPGLGWGQAKGWSRGSPGVEGGVQVGIQQRNRGESPSSVWHSCLLGLGSREGEPGADGAGSWAQGGERKAQVSTRLEKTLVGL